MKTLVILISFTIFLSACGTVNIVNETEKGGRMEFIGQPGTFVKDQADAKILKKCTRGYRVVESGLNSDTTPYQDFVCN